MSFELHPELVTPPDDTVLWRYSDFAKFIDLLERRKLWFSRADNFEDPLEGTFTDAEIDHFKATDTSGSDEILAQSYLELSKMMRRTVFLNCWREGIHESMAMWDIYGKGSGVVAINTTVGLIKEAVASFPFPVFISRVKYQDWRSISWRGNALAMCTRKDMSYSHEAEVRAIIWALGQHAGGRAMFNCSNDNAFNDLPAGVEVDVDPARLITQIVVGPREQSRTSTLLQAVARRYGLPAEIKLSDRLKARI